MVTFLMLVACAFFGYVVGRNVAPSQLEEAAKTVAKDIESKL